MSVREAGVRLEFDDIIFKLQRFGGITEYWRELTSGIEAIDGFQVSRCRAPAWQRLLSVRSSARVFHSSYLRVARGPRVRNVITVHDLAFELGLASKGLRQRLGRIERRRAYFRADALICVSESTRRDLLRLFPALGGEASLHVIHHGPTVRAEDPGLPLDQVVPLGGAPYVLFVGTRRLYKNFAGGLAGFAQSGLAAQGFRLVCAGPPMSEEESVLIRQHGLEAQVRILGPVGRAGLVSLYRHAHCLLYPSLFEGFGMPVLEAMVLGCPVVAANCTSIPEIAGDAALLVERGEPPGLARALTALTEPGVRGRCVEAGRQRAQHFSWERSIESHASVYRSLG